MAVRPEFLTMIDGQKLHRLRAYRRELAA